MDLICEPGSQQPSEDHCMPRPRIWWSQGRVFLLCNILCCFYSSWFSFFISGPSFLSFRLPVFMPSSLPFIPNKKQSKETAVKVF